MEKKPIRRSQSLMPLSREHHYSLLFCWKLRQGVKLNVEKKRITDYIAYFYERCLLPHFEEEENVLFVLVSDRQTERAIQEHCHIKTLVRTVLSSGETIEYRVFEQLADAVDKHVRFEERELFSHIESILTEDQLQETGTQLSLAPILNDEYEDHFWEKK